MDIKRSIMIKLIPNELEDIGILFDNYRGYVSHTIKHIEKIYNMSEQIENEEGVCSICNNYTQLSFRQTKDIKNKPIKNPLKICYNCFTKQWSEYTLYTEYKDELINLSNLEIFPLLSVHQGYYYGVISTAVKVFKSYIGKKEDRDALIKKSKENCVVLEGRLNNLDWEIKQTKKAIRNGKPLTKQLASFEKDKKETLMELKREKRLSRRKKVSFPFFKGNEIFLGKNNMFRFEVTGNQYMLGITDYKQKNHRIWFMLKIANYQKRFIDDCIYKENEVRKKMSDPIFKEKIATIKDKIANARKELKSSNAEEKKLLLSKISELKNEKLEFDIHTYKDMYPKLIRRKVISDGLAKRKKTSPYEYYFILPFRDMCKVLTSKADIMDYIAKNPDTEICCLSFGIKTPIGLFVMKDRKIIDSKSFGDGTLYNRIENGREIRAKIYNAIGQRYKHNHPHNQKDKILHQKKRKALNKINDKIGFRDSRFINYYNQKLTHDVIRYIRENYQKPVIVLRDTKNIKNINYSGILSKRRDRWSIQQQKTMIRYKALLNEISVYQIKYSMLNIVRCSRCGEKYDDLKVTTEKLKFETDFICAKCNYRNLFLVNDELNLWSQMCDILAEHATARMGGMLDSPAE